MEPETTFFVDGLLVDEAAHTIGIGNESVRIEPRLMKLLALLASRPGRTINRVELLDSAWKEAPYVSDESLTKAISELRKILAAFQADSQFIQTVPKNGYRLVASVMRPDTTQGSNGTTYPSHAATESPEMAAPFSGEGSRSRSKPSQGIGFRPGASANRTASTFDASLSRSIHRLKIAVAAVIVFVLVAVGLMLSGNEQRVRIRRVAVPGTGIVPDSPLARVLSDTTYVLEPGNPDIFAQLEDGIPEERLRLVHP